MVRTGIVNFAWHDRSPIERIALFIILTGILTRLAFWQTTPPAYKLFSVFAYLDSPSWAYLGNFESYKPTRSAFFDAFAALFYHPLSQFIGYQSLTLSTTTITAASLPFVFDGTRKMLNDKIAVFSLTLYTFHPKFLVLTAQGMPETASLGFLTFGFWGLARGQNNPKPFYYLVAGLGLMLSFLMYIPAVGAAIVVVLFVYFDETKRNYFGGEWFDMRSLLPSWRVIMLASPSAITGLLYLKFGPIIDLLNTSTGQSRTAALFIRPEYYSTFEKAIRYIGYTYYDFWWHVRGFDHEGMVFSSLSNVSSFFGSISPILLLGWLVVTMTLSTLILLGIWLLIKRKRSVDIFIFSWIAMYVIIFQLRNAGWKGAFQTRHVFPIFLPICLAFGIGMLYMLKHVEIHLGDSRALSSIFQYSNIFNISTVVITFLLSMLVLSALINGYVHGQNNDITHVKPVNALESEIQPDSEVGIVDRGLYNTVVLYSEGRIRPKIYVENQKKLEPKQYRTVLADIRILDASELSNAKIDYIFLRSVCGDFTKRKQSFLRTAKDDWGHVVYRDATTWSQNCTTRTVIIKRNGQA